MCQLNVINKIYKGNQQQAIFETNFRDLIWKCEHGYANDSEDSDDHIEHYQQNYIYRDYKKRSLDESSTQRSSKFKNLNQYNQFFDVFPSRNTFKFTNGIQITSNFDAGNLMECHEIKPD